MNKIRVYINEGPLKNGNAFRGVGEYTRNLIEALGKKKNLRLVKANEDPEIVHYPYFDPFFLTLPLIKRRPTVVTIHDVISLIYPEYYPKGIRGWLKFQIQKFSLKSVAAVITDSKSSKKDIINYLEFPEERTFVIPLASGEEFKKIEAEDLKLKVKKKYNLPERFILYVGDVNWNKNVEGLIRAFKHLISTSEVSPRVKLGGPSTSEVKLFLVGKAFEDKNLPEMRLILQLIKELNLIDKIKILGYVSTKDLVGIYNLATVYCQPSFYEGFGLPVLEAMACGCPVVAANASSLPEICGKAALMVDPYDINDIAEKIWEVISDKEIKDKLVRRGPAQAKQFSWEKTAYETYKVYQKVVGE